MAFTETFLAGTTGVQRVTSLLHLLRDYISGSENTEGAAVTVEFETADETQPFNSYMVYTVRLPADKGYEDNGQVHYDPFELP